MYLWVHEMSRRIRTRTCKNKALCSLPASSMSYALCSAPHYDISGDAKKNFLGNKTSLKGYCDVHFSQLERALLLPRRGRAMGSWVSWQTKVPTTCIFFYYVKFKQHIVIFLYVHTIYHWLSLRLLNHVWIWFERNLTCTVHAIKETLVIWPPYYLSIIGNVHWAIHCSAWKNRTIHLTAKKSPGENVRTNR